MEKKDSKLEIEYIFDESGTETTRKSLYFSKEFRTQFGIAFTVNLFIFIAGIHIGWVAPTIFKLSSNNSDITLTSSEISWLTAMLPLGSGIGPIFGAVLANSLGRKNVILLATIPEIITWIVIAFAKNVYHLCVALFVKGIVHGSAMLAVPMYLGEILSPQFRGRMLGMLFQLCWIFGALFQTILVPYVSVATNAWIVSSIPIILLVILIWIPESPYYYLMKNQPENARKSLQILQIDNVDHQLEHLRKVIRKEQNEVTKFSEIFRVKSNRVSFILCLGIIFTQHLTGLSIILPYTQILIEKSNLPIEPHLSGILISILGLIWALCSFFFIDSLGRRPVFLFATFGTMLPCFLIGLYFHLEHNNYSHINSIIFLPFIALIIHQVTASPGVTSLPHVFLSEMLSTNIKGFASLFICCLSSICHGMISKFFNNLCDLIGIHNVFYLLVFGCFISGIGTYFFVPETKGKTLDEIQNFLKSYHMQRL